MTFSARIYDYANSGKVTRIEFFDMVAYGSYHAYDFMTRHKRKMSPVPLPAGPVDI
jgi:hypothetical protein